MKIKRSLLETIESELKTSNKGIVIYGPRQSGKTTLVNDVISDLNLKALYLNGDQRGSWWEILTSRELSKIKLLIGDYEAIFIDEAQRIPEIGISIKIIIDNFPEKKVIITGSSSLDLASKISEPLTGRIYTYKLFPISYIELKEMYTAHELNVELEERLIFGSYPEVFSLTGIKAKTTYLANLMENYLYKDLLEFGDIRNSSKIHDLLRLLAFQIGSQVSINELATTLEMSRASVDRYIDLLEKSFVVFRLQGFSRNLRKEVTKMDKIYFYDVGVRNAIIDNFNLLTNRNDQGVLWENFLVVERMKKQKYSQGLFSHYFWRLASGAELDLVEERNGTLYGYEFKSGSKTVKVPSGWQKAYPNSQFQCINRNNYLDFILREIEEKKHKNA